MKENVSNGNPVTPMLFPYQPEQFWQLLRQVIREEVTKAENEKPNVSSFETPGMTYKPLYKITEICTIFHITKPTVYDWVKHGKLKPFKVRSRVFFLWQDIQQLLHGNSS
ncbi:helix-turn-helix domain-containing protein [Pinibacter aurantiacus]|uniref:Helix-turn-helix domain-containing protein n=1 Tax=Pinibacter aurantiacus TaxID=2851599 RepID=A0A9E2W817_9BACT|nr:helix-turn-helix domain-containing protein [Pinibacter aurantiacus]MBV4357362.1 helix-turn-helix domain-containing protein [Pinibacter aurantiacus]